MRTHSRRTWPLFAGDVLVIVLGTFVLHGPAAGVVLFLGSMALIGTCIYALAGEDVKDGAGGIAGGTSF